MHIQGNVVVTGANRGIGFALVTHLAAMPSVSRIFAACRAPDAADDLIKFGKENTKVKVIKLDVQYDLSIQLAVKEVEFQCAGEGIGLLINNAGICETTGSDFLNPNRSSYWRHFDVNVIGAVITSKVFLHLLRKPDLKKDGSPGEVASPSIVVNVTSMAGSTSNLLSQSLLETGNVVYGMSKAALNNFTAGFASMEFGNGVAVFGFAPSWTRTRIGGYAAPYTASDTARALLNVIQQATMDVCGKVLDCSGEIVPF